MSVESEHLVEPPVEAGGRVRAGVDEGGHLGLPAGVDGGRVHLRPEAVEVVDLEAAEEVVAALVDGVVAAAGGAEGVQHLRPDRRVTAAILGLGPGQELHRESDAFHANGSPGWCSPGGRRSPGLRVRS